MSEEKPSPLIIDANSLIDLIKLGALFSVAQLAEYQFLVIDEVVSEVRRPEQARILKEAIRRGLISKVSISTPDELELFAKLQTVLDLGEAASLAYASINQPPFSLRRNTTGIHERSPGSHRREEIGQNACGFGDCHQASEIGLLRTKKRTGETQKDSIQLKRLGRYSTFPDGP